MSGSGVFEQLNTAGLRAIGLKPQWVDHPNDAGDYAALPSIASAGVYLEEAPRTMGQVALRENVAYRTARVKIGTAALTGTIYTVTIAGTGVAYNSTSAAPANLAALVQGIADAINANGTVNLIVTASADPDDDHTVLIIGDEDDDGDDFSIDASVSGGTGSIDTITADATDASLRFFASPGGIVRTDNDGYEGSWSLPPDATWTLDRFGWIQRLDTAGVVRGYLQVYDVAGHVDDATAIVLTVAAVQLGPCVVEATA